MLLALEGIAGAGKSTVRDRLLSLTADRSQPAVDLGQFSWLDPDATRTLIQLRAGGKPGGALDAARRDLGLHVTYNLAPARAAGLVLADRWIISTACLLALSGRRGVDYHLAELAAQTSAHPEVTVLLTTPAHVCLARIWRREAGRRFVEEPRIASQLAELYERAASAWTRLTGATVVRHTCRTEEDLESITSRCLHLIGEHTMPGEPDAP
ncbi:hypothetical protein KDK95_05830 [Actinospica sp. MGRD01-02]|uniref:Thymidylate kinase n=1 Tax=Actinospica acidithermotolerans TaxID=2828514 RepID=A0A941E951_9ACTN|nr:hypothetical protein [Actinospica acidithermotolerans]MBR7825820.1 hypothetical protein [Actinospica acidithermotolerans]